MTHSDDPRINRINLEGENISTPEQEHWPTWEVFHQRKRGEQHVHAGIVHAPSADLALVFAKEQYGRRQKCSNIWVVPSSEITAFSYEDEDIFYSAVSPEKKYREASGFSVRDKINEYKKQHQITAPTVGKEGYFGGIQYD